MLSNVCLVHNFNLLFLVVLAFRPFLGRRSLGEVGWPSLIYKTGMQPNLTGKVGFAALNR
jgi:hypothetical protein